MEHVHNGLPFTEASTGMDNRYGTHSHGDETFLVSRTVRSVGGIFYRFPAENVEILRKSLRGGLTGTHRILPVGAATLR